MDALLWPGSYKLSVEAIDEGRSKDEWLEEELPPGEYVLTVYALDAGSNYLLATSDDPEWTGPDANDGGLNPEQ